MRHNILKSKYQAIARAMTRNFSVNVVFDGGGARTDGHRTIYLPSNADELPHHDQRSLDGWLDHEGCHVEEEIKAEQNGSTSPIALMNGAAKRKGPKYQLMLNVYEDIRIERAKAATHPGVAENLQLINERSIRAYQEGRVQDAWQDIAGAIIATGRGLDTSWVSGNTKTVIDLIGDELAAIPSMRTPDDAWDLAQRTVEKIKELAEEAQEEQEQREEQGEGDEGQEGEESEGAEGEDEQDGEGQADGEGEGDEQEQGQSGNEADEDGDGEGDEAEGQADGEGSEGGSEGAEDGDGEPGSEDGEGQGQGRGVQDLSDEELEGVAEALADLCDEQPQNTDMIEHARRSVNIAAVEEAQDNGRLVPDPATAKRDGMRPAPEGNLDKYNEAKADVNEQIGTLKRKLATMLRAKQQVHFQGDKEDGTLDAASLYAVRSGERRVFAQRTVAENTNTAITLLIDLSGSMGRCDTKKDKRGQRAGLQDRAWYAQRAAVALAETLDSIGVPFEVLGFDSERSWKNLDNIRRGAFHIYPFKQFSETLRKTRARFSEMGGRDHNGDGDAVMFAAKRLAARPESRKVLIVISDGQPNGPANKELLQKDLRRVITEVSASGIEVLGIGANNGAVRDYYNKQTGAAHVVINDLDKLAASIFKLIRSKLTRIRRTRAA